MRLLRLSSLLWSIASFHAANYLVHAAEGEILLLCSNGTVHKSLGTVSLMLGNALI